ncbi:MerR family transcriptional regulator [Ferroacidibacillus organovorans]|uniref:Transcriptional regulator n=1 Tax=Ferroacidibacillus organovorans TaxID=1765683 RepID=A0A162T1A4_9BACL|nr:MerR family transcriptional regulator [Ferroacidibacillus organovorans]KYP80356.1 transcriptional regulator [Ferroacidibacillus organovorans]OAG93336.1 transcriptional regulator [Ferroacidibacillus organovorans]OPG16498.1 MerR family transcriptional regulator [Ferroacidibacillus organovorans]
MDDATRRNLALFPIGIVQRLTDLTARQIRYYEQNELIHPERTDGNQRLFSFNDVERLLEIKSLIDKGLNIAGIKAMIHKNDPGQTGAIQRPEATPELTDTQLHELLMREISEGQDYPGVKTSMIQGELSRFFHKS